MSLCLLSQLIDQLTEYVEPSDPRFGECVAAARSNHLQTLLGWTKPGGRACLISDIVSSDTAAELRLATEEGLPALLASLLRRGDFFQGLHPGVIASELQSDARWGERVAKVVVQPPWLWDLGPRRFAVVCYLIDLAGGDDEPDSLTT